jgi:hypothetical protein
MLKVKLPRCIYNPLYMSSPGTLSTVPVVALALLWSTLDLDCGRSGYFVVFFVTLGLRWAFQVSVPCITLQGDIHCGYPQIDLEAQLSTVKVIHW